MAAYCVLKLATRSACGCEEYSRLTAAERNLSLLTEAVPVFMLTDTTCI
jgi:hypothetical protein